MKWRVKRREDGCGAVMTSFVVRTEAKRDVAGRDTSTLDVEEAERFFYLK